MLCAVYATISSFGVVWEEIVWWSDVGVGLNYSSFAGWVISTWCYISNLGWYLIRCWAYYLILDIDVSALLLGKDRKLYVSIRFGLVHYSIRFIIAGIQFYLDLISKVIWWSSWFRDSIFDMLFGRGGKTERD